MSIPSWSQEDLAALRRDIEELRKAKGLPSAATAQQAWEKVGDGGVFQAFFGKYGGFPPWKLGGFDDQMDFMGEVVISRWQGVISPTMVI